MFLKAFSIISFSIFSNFTPSGKASSLIFSMKEWEQEAQEAEATLNSKLLPSSSKNEAHSSLLKASLIVLIRRGFSYHAHLQEKIQFNWRCCKQSFDEDDADNEHSPTWEFLPVLSDSKEEIKQTQCHRQVKDNPERYVWKCYLQKNIQMLMGILGRMKHEKILKEIIKKLKEDSDKKRWRRNKNKFVWVS